MKTNNKSFLDEVIDEVIEEGSNVLLSVPKMGEVSTSFINNNMGVEPLKYDVKSIGDEEAEFAQTAGNNRPFPLETIHDSFVEAYLHLDNTERLILSCLKYNISLDTKNKRNGLKEIFKKVKQLKNQVKESAGEIDELFINTRPGTKPMSDRR